jgi:hypothetical protein
MEMSFIPAIDLMMKSSIMATLLGASLTLASVDALASSAQHGTIRCGGNHFVRLGGTELHFVNYVFRNRSMQTPISVDRIVFFDATGQMIYDTQISGFPQFSNGVLGPHSQVLAPNQTGQLDVTSFLPYLTETQRPMQAQIHWSSPKKALPLSVDLIRLVQQLDPATRARGAEKTRDSQDCDEVGDGE